jgi:hypothetical protein
VNANYLEEKPDVTSLILFACKNVGFQKLDLNLFAYEIIKASFFFPPLKS